MCAQTWLRTRRRAAVPRLYTKHTVRVTKTFDKPNVGNENQRSDKFACNSDIAEARIQDREQCFVDRCLGASNATYLSTRISLSC